jgi:uncharacterized caspase-like protein
MIRRYRALLVANGEYPEDRPNLPSLKGPVNDLNLLRSALVDPSRGMFDPGDVTTRPDQTSGHLLRELARFFRAADRDDLLLFYYSGHGQLDFTQTLHLCTRDTVAALLPGTSISSTQLNAFIDNSAAACTVIILDCCHSGAFKAAADIAAPVGGRGRYVMAGCRATELANDAPGANHPSPFTETLVAGLRGSAAARGSARYLTLDDLYEYTYERLRSAGAQTPQRIGRGEGSVAIARITSTSSPTSSATASVVTSPADLATPRTATVRRIGPWVVAATIAVAGTVAGGLVLDQSGRTPDAPASTVTGTAGPAGRTGDEPPSSGRAGAQPLWLPTTVPGTTTPPYGIHVESPANDATVSGPCLEIDGTSRLPSGKTLLVADRNLDGPPARPFIYTPIEGWDRLPPSNTWRARISLGTGVGQRYQVAVLAADTNTVRTTWQAVTGPVTSDTAVPDLELAAQLTVTQKDIDNRTCIANG